MTVIVHYVQLNLSRVCAAIVTSPPKEKQSLNLCVIYHSGLETLFDRGDPDRSTHVTDIEIERLHDSGSKASPSDLKKHVIFRAPILKGKSHSITFPNRLPMPKISVFGKIWVCDRF